MKTTCQLCPFACNLSVGEIGQCKVRGNVSGSIQLLTYGQITSLAVGPIEDKPIYHFYPGMKVLSVGGSGCNMRCKYCQNFEISQVGDPEASQISPDDIVKTALRKKAKGIAFTYSEPIVWYEYVMDVSKAAQKVGLKTILKTNGYGHADFFDQLLSQMDAVNIDLKGGPRFYREICGIDVEDNPNEWLVMRNLLMAQQKSHAEVSIMVIPGYEDEINELLKAIPGKRNECILHFLRFVPDFQMRNHKPPTNDQMFEAKNMAENMGFKFVYIDYAGMDTPTMCPSCNEEIIVRSGMEVIQNTSKNGHCPACNTWLKLVG